jgi:hypothetical protein
MYLRQYSLAIILIAALLPFLAPVSSETRLSYATLQGTVTTFDNFGEQLPLAWVRVNATSRAFNLTIYTNANGFYQMVLPTGTYRISTYLRGYSTVIVNMTLTPGQTMISNFYLRWQVRGSPSPS